MGVSYVDATADAIGDLMAIAGHPVPPAYHTLLQVSMVVVLYPATYIRSLKNVVPISIASFIGALVVVGCVVGQCVQGILRDGITFTPAMWPANAGIFLKTLPTAVTVFSIQAGGSITMSALADGSEQNKSKVSLIAYIIVLVINMAVGLPSYLRFGDATAGNVLSSLPPTSTLTIIAKVACLLLVVPSYMFMMIPCRVALIELLFKCNEAKQEATWTQFLAVTTCVNIAAVFVATLVSDLSLVIGLVGAIAANSVAFILPCTFFVKARSAPKVKDFTAVPVKSLSNVPYLILIIFAFFSMISGIAFLLNLV